MPRMAWQPRSPKNIMKNSTAHWAVSRFISALTIHWARLIELLYAAERIVELATDPEITSDKFHTVPTEKPTEGVGIVEAPRGTLTHHYKTDERGILTEVNLIVGTTNNYAPITMSIKKAAQSLIKKGTVVNEGMLNMVEMAFRAYDPCFGCATHSLPAKCRWRSPSAMRMESRLKC